MEVFPLDISAEQVVEWLIDEERAGRSRLRVSASRSYLPEDIPAPQEHGMGDEESEDLSEVTPVGTLEVAPADSSEGWLLRVRIQDELGGRLPEDPSALEQAEEVDLPTFRQQFLLPGRCTAFITVEAETGKARALFEKLLNDMKKNTHPG